MKKSFFKPKFFVLVLFFMIVIFSSGCTRISWPDFHKQSESKNSDVAPGQIAVIENNIIVSQPLSNDAISSPVKVSGKIVFSADKVYFRLLDDWNNLVATSSAEINQTDLNYETAIEFPKPFTQKGVLEGYVLSADGQKEASLVKIPIVFKEYNKPLFKLYYSNSLKTTNPLNCDEVFPIEKEVVVNQELPKNVIKELFKGLSEEEIKLGYINNLPEKVEINKIEYSNRKVILDFGSEFTENLNYKCRLPAMIAQITQTLLQFEDIDEVAITVEGKEIK